MLHKLTVNFDDDYQMRVKGVAERVASRRFVQLHVWSHDTKCYRRLLVRHQSTDRVQVLINRSKDYRRVSTISSIDPLGRSNRQVGAISSIDLLGLSTGHSRFSRHLFFFAHQMPHTISHMSYSCLNSTLHSLSGAHKLNEKWVGRDIDSTCAAEGT